jgi:hypothetical protein
MAFRSPGGAVAAQRKLTQGMGEKDDLAFSPILLEMAKIIGRTGLPPGFFLQNDEPFPDGSPGVDLRTLLLYQAGLIKMPIRLVTGRKSPQENETPTLMLPSIPEPRKGLTGTSTDAASTLPSLASSPLPRDTDRDQVVTPKRSIGNPEKISIARNPDNVRPQAPPESPQISLDISKLEADLQVYGEEEPAKPPEVKADVPQLAMAMPRHNAMPFITQNAFRLWTYKPEDKEQSKSGEIETALEYNSTFVVATIGAIKSITGRHFVLGPGKLLASNKGGELLLKTPLANISVEPNATVVVEIGQSGGATTVDIYPIESKAGSAVKVEVPNVKEGSYNLSAGQALVVANQKASPTASRKSFQVKDFVEHELIAKPKASLDVEHYSALSSLKKRVSETAPH